MLVRVLFVMLGLSVASIISGEYREVLLAILI